MWPVVGAHIQASFRSYTATCNISSSSCPHKHTTSGLSGTRIHSTAQKLKHAAHSMVTLCQRGFELRVNSEIKSWLDPTD